MYVKPSSSYRTVLILDIGNVFCNPFVDFPKISDNAYNVVLYVIIKNGEAHSESLYHSNTPKSHSLWISFRVVAKYFWGIEKA